jgi:hypothetical protein
MEVGLSAFLIRDHNDIHWPVGKAKSCNVEIGV